MRKPRWRYWLLALALIAPACARHYANPAASLAPFEKNKLWGYQDRRGRVVIPERYKLADEFTRFGLAMVLDQKGWLYINAQGQEMIRPYIYDNGPDYFQEGLARFVQDGKFGYFDQTGKVVIAPGYDFAYPFANGWAKVGFGCRLVAQGEHQEAVGGVWMEIDKQGKVRP